MIQATKWSTQYLIATVLSAMALAFSYEANAQTTGLSGTWILERSVDFDGFVNSPKTDLPPNLQILGDRFLMPRGCVVRLQREPTSMGDIFQNLLKADVTNEEIGAFYQKQFKMEIYQVKASLKNNPKDIACYRGAVDFLQIGESLIAIEGGGQFSFLYKRATTPKNSAGEIPYSQLPFLVSTYETLCSKAIIWSGKKPTGATKRCEPLYFPRIATASSTDTLARLVGHHNYEGSAVGLRSSLTNDYNNPVDSGFSPIFHAFAPKGDITLVYVTDVEGSQSRDAMPGAYLSIRNNKVVSQLNSNCTMGLDYICRETDSTVHYVINGKGEFIQQNR
jgi:hypothetical protein